MKKLILFLLLATISRQLNAQIPAEFIYNEPKPGKLLINIHFYLGNGMRMTLELYNRAQLDSVKNIETLLHKVWADLQHVKDSIKKPFVSKRIDYIVSSKSAHFRILEHPSYGATYSYNQTNEQLLQTKTDNDTLRIKLQTFDRIIKDSLRLYNPFFIMFTLNKMEDIFTIKPGVIDSALATVQNKARTGKPINGFKKMYASYNVETHKWSPFSYDWYSKKKTYFEPDIYMGFQYVRGAWASSFAAGFQLIKGDYEGERDVFKLLWDPHFFFSRDRSNSLNTERNDFITFRYDHYDKKTPPDDDWPSGFSVGYLVRRKGNWYEPHTFKFSIPGIHFKFLSLEPEFFFNDFFKHFSPSLKLNFNID